MTVLPPADADNNSLHWLQKDDLHYLARWCPQKWWGRWWLMFHRSGFVWRASPLYSLLLISIPREFPLAVRVIGMASSILFFITSSRIFWGEALSPISSPLPFFAYPFLVLTFIGWIWTLLREA